MGDAASKTVRGRRALAAALILIGLPVALALAEAIVFHVRNRNNGSIASSGEQREYLLFVPKSYDRTRPTPLVISLHGAATWPAIQRDMSHWNRLAESQGFIVVYPSGVEAAGPRIWRVFRGPGLARDIRFISELIDELRSAYNVDPDRIYANGISNGGGMTFALSCALSDRIAAVGTVAAAQTLPWSWCEERRRSSDDRPVPVIAFHGTNDPMVPYGGGTSWMSSRPFPGVAVWITRWARRNRCGAVPVESAPARDVTRLEYPDCAGGAAVVLYRIHDLGHSWPGGMPLPEWLFGPNSNAVDATGEMWRFFQEHPLRGRASPLSSRRPSPGSSSAPPSS